MTTRVVDSAGLTQTGNVRRSNEDSFLLRSPLFMVADGMGGAAAGEIASAMAVEIVLAELRATWVGRPDARGSEGFARALKQATRAANDQINAYASRHQEFRGMGTTATIAGFLGDTLYVAQVGDSRAYLVRDGRCTQLTADHSRVGEMLRLGLLTPEQAASHPARSQLTKSLGSDPMLQVDVVRSELATGDVFVLCSDGLWDSVGRAEIAEVASAVGTSAAPTVVQAADQLVDLALAREAPDNVTALVVKVTSDRPIPPVAARRSLFRRAR